MILILPVQTAHFRVGDVELLHRAGHTDVTQATLLFETPRLFGRHLAREHTLFHTDHKHQRKL
ncbi:Uncharacterised protein [Vibrio cholerae]|nr:Uncharacterised protein [Vibrio cholerae]CSA78047.1 Uncharacterised protein [Vibrio cholerae]CSB95598.1 Uncharacterised protein [Vibrio cholerae]CSC17798.1 Uncharacterised protein [Vibrio cholerae]